MELTTENISRKVDATGRVVIPRTLRERIFVEANDEVWFSSLEYEGTTYICLTGSKTVDPRYYATAKVLKELGAELPKELTDALNRDVSTPSQ